jgi:putative redox protein
MRSAIARRRNGYEHEVAIREHRLTVDEPEDRGGTDTGPSPGELLAAALATCSAITIEMYADRKQWGLGTVEVEVDYTEQAPDEPASFDVRIRVGGELTDENRDRLMVIAGKCPVHKALAADNVQIRDSLEETEDFEDED